MGQDDSELGKCVVTDFNLCEFGEMKKLERNSPIS